MQKNADRNHPGRQASLVRFPVFDFEAGSFMQANWGRPWSKSEPADAENRVGRDTWTLATLIV